MSSSWAASALSWWEEAGVDAIVGEAPRDWLNPKAKAPSPPPAPASEAPPGTLEGFRKWLDSTDSLPFATPSAPRVGPSGDPASGLMILVDMPALADFEAGTLLAGEAGVLFDRMLAAIGRSRETVYLASLSTIRTATGAIDSASAARLADIARHHIGLVAPTALLLFGDTCGKALVGSAVAGARARWHEIATPAGPIKTLVTMRPHDLQERPALKTHAWADLKLLREELTP